MSKAEHFHSPQIDDMKQREEMMREYRAQQETEEAKEAARTRRELRKAELSAASAATCAPAEPALPGEGPLLNVVQLTEQDARDARDAAATTVRGTKDNLQTEAVLSAWETDVHTDAALHGGLVPPKASHTDREIVVRLNGEPAPLPPPSDTETELNGLIAECRYLIREVACASARLTYDPEDRVRFLASAQSMTLAAAEVGKMVAKLRAASAKTPRLEERRQLITVEHVQRTLPQGGEGGTEISAESSHQ